MLPDADFRMLKFSEEVARAQVLVFCQFLIGHGRKGGQPGGLERAGDLFRGQRRGPFRDSGF